MKGQAPHGAPLSETDTHRKLEEELRLAQERYPRILDTYHDIVLVIDSGARIRFANKAWHKNISYTLDQINRIDLFETIHPDDRAMARDMFGRVLAGGSAHGVEYRGIATDGRMRWFEADADPIDWPGAEKALLLVVHDISDRMRIEEALRAYHRFLEIANRHSEPGPLLDEFVNELASFTGCQAVGIRILDEQGNIPYKAWRGFPPEFIDVESPLCIHSHSCVCINVITGEIKPNLPLTEAGSFLTGSTTALISSLSERERGEVRATCNRFGYESVALIPIRVDARIMGLIHVADPSPHKISPERVTVLDKAALQLGAALARVKTKQALIKSEERYRNIFWEAPDIFYILDLDTWIITDANKCALQKLEYGPEFLGRIHVTDIIHPDDMEIATGRLKDMVIKKDRMPNFPLRILTRTGKMLYIEQSGVIFWDEEGHARSFLGLAHDVTVRKAHEETIRKRNEELTALYEVARSANKSLDLNTLANVMLDVVPRITNSDSMAIYSYNEKEQIFTYLAHRGLPEEFVKGTDHLKLYEGVHGLMFREKRPLLLNSVRTHPGLSRRSAVEQLGDDSVIMAPLMAKDKILGSLVVSRRPGHPYDENDLGIVQAIANQIAVAMANAKLHSELLEREAKLHSILETSRDGVFVTSEKRRVIFGNRALLDMFRYTENDDVSEIDTMRYFAPESYHVLEETREKLGRGEPLDEIIKFKARRKDGSLFDAELRLGFFVENGQRFDVGIIRDVTERNRMEFQLHQASKLAAIGELAAGVAHEINNPVANISVQTGLMQEIVEESRDKIDSTLFQRIRKYLELVEQQADRCNSIVNDLLSFSRMPERHNETFDLNKLIKKTVNLITQLTDKEPRIEFRLDERLPRLNGDPNRLEQVFANLLTNALKAIEPRGVISIASQFDNKGNFRILFNDSGGGIPAEMQDRIFDPFFTTDPEGTGLGLAISYYIISQMNGTLEVESDPGSGTTFTITLKSESAESGGEG